MIYPVSYPDWCWCGILARLFETERHGYIRASGWKKSPDVEDYQEARRMAGIFVLRAIYLPGRSLRKPDV